MGTTEAIRVAAWVCVLVALGCGATERGTRRNAVGAGAAGTVGVAGDLGGAGTFASGNAGSFGAAGVAANGGSAGVLGTAGVGGLAGTFSASFGGSGGTMAAAGAGGMGGAGTAGSAGAAGGGGAGTGGVTQSMGCGAATWPAAGDKTADVSGTQRAYIVALPSGYDPKKPYKLIFAWHYLNGTAAGIKSGGYYGLESRAANSAIFVAPQGIDNAWPNTGGRDVAFTQVMLDFMRSNYCIDEERIFSVGFSYGAIMSNTVGCAFGDVFRAIAPMSGSGPRGTCKGQVAAWLSHGDSDTTVSFASGQASRDYWVKANHCATTTKTVGSCVAYDGCDAGFPVHWCQFSGGHTRPSFAPDAIWAFFSQF